MSLHTLPQPPITVIDVLLPPGQQILEADAFAELKAQTLLRQSDDSEQICESSRPFAAQISDIQKPLAHMVLMLLQKVPVAMDLQTCALLEPSLSLTVPYVIPPLGQQTRDALYSAADLAHAFFSQSEFTWQASLSPCFLVAHLPLMHNPLAHIE